MKRYCLIIATVLAFAGLMLGDNVCPTPKACEVPFAYDTNLVNYRIIGSYQVELGASIVRDFNSCDPDEDNAGFVYEKVAGPNDVVLTAEGHLVWQPSSVGLYYLDFRVWDKPIAGAALSDTGTIVVRVFPANRAPVMGGCSQ